MKGPSVAVVILNWNGKMFLEQFLPSVFNSSYYNLQVVVGDNYSTDDSIAYLKENFPLVKVIQNDANYGFAEGYNKVLEQVEADYFVLLNSDVEVHYNWIKPVIDLMESDDNIAIAQPKIKSIINRKEFEYAGAAGGFLDVLMYPFCRGRIFGAVEKDNNQYNDDCEIFWASGCALFIKSAIWKRVNGLDANFFAHMEEIDLCWRVKNLGYKVMYCAKSTVWHVGGGTLAVESPHKTYLNFRNNYYLIRKNLKPSKAFWVIPFRFCLDFLALIKFLFAGKFKNAMAISKAHRNVILSFFSDKISFNKDISEKPNTTGLYKNSIVWDYFVLNNKTFNRLRK
ncbi:glycosyltransferase family 2 protein [Pedobacter arcticus]|uniref:glycosyltransferase family 2 protein n=1 Tax=Pedobacter arcticus TaxID=752140 RepID=UPI0002FF7E74|nr:glycosyltransferase family 2 protein [Pedobacter arcticus]